MSNSNTNVPPSDAEVTAVAVYKSARHDMMYVYLPALEAAPAADDQAESEGDNEAEKADLGVLPAELMQRFGRPVFTMVFDLWPSRKLAQVQATAVLDAISTQGFYLQMPPSLRLPPTPDELNVHG